MENLAHLVFWQSKNQMNCSFQTGTTKHFLLLWSLIYKYAVALFNRCLFMVCSLGIQAISSHVNLSTSVPAKTTTIKKYRLSAVLKINRFELVILSTIDIPTLQSTNT